MLISHRNLSLVFRFVPQVIISTQTDELIVLCITFLRNSEYIRNPYLKSGLVSLLFHGTWPVYHRQKGVLGDALTGEKFANDNLLHALMKFYIGTLFKLFWRARNTNCIVKRPSQQVLMGSFMRSSIFDTKYSRS